jgi:RNA polymerase sigma-70 factor (ECF subfamily)
VHAIHSIPPAGRGRVAATKCTRATLASPLPPRSASLQLVPENRGAAPAQVLNWLPLPALRGTFLQFQSFDEAYVERLRAGDFRTQEHFGAYFSALIHVKLRSRLQSREAIEDVRQETFARFFKALHERKILHPERLGAYVNSMCNHVLSEHYRSGSRETPLEEDEQKELPSNAMDLLGVLVVHETGKKVQEILEQLSERDRRLLREIFIEERDKDEVCRDFGVDREYLRVLLHRAKRSFKDFYLNNNDSPGFSAA